MKKLKGYRKSVGLSQADVAKKLGVTQNAVSQWENGYREPTIETIVKLAEIYNVPPEKLLDFSGQDDSDPGWQNIHLKPVPEFAETAFTVPLVASLRCGFSSAGIPNFDVMQKVELPPSYRDRYGDDIVLIKAIGESMIPNIRPRDLLICKPGSGWNNGDVVDVNVDDSDTIKRIYRAEDGGIDLVPDNPKFRKMHFTPEDLQEYPPHVLGRIVRNMGQDM